jgi:hypothetical protein
MTSTGKEKFSKVIPQVLKFFWEHFDTSLQISIYIFWYFCVAVISEMLINYKKTRKYLKKILSLRGIWNDY